MSEYDVEKSKRESSELRAAFAEIFPLANEQDLPWAPCQIKAFLHDRIRREVESGAFHFTARVVKVLCEVSPPKTHVEDMARIAVEECKTARAQAEQLRERVKMLEQKLAEARRGEVTA
jgi:hypothetical protein